MEKKDGINSNVSTISEEYEALLKHAQEQPGITELMQAYGRYDEFIKQAKAYLPSIQPKDIISTTNSTS